MSLGKEYLGRGAMLDERIDERTEDPQNTHRASFLTGWTDAVNGK
jgi:hypothetical protein